MIVITHSLVLIKLFPKLKKKYSLKNTGGCADLIIKAKQNYSDANLDWYKINTTTLIFT